MSVQAAGSIAGGVVTSRLIRRLGEGRTLGLGLLMWAIASLIYTMPAVPAAFTALALFGIAVALFAVAVATAAQRYTPPWLQGRVTAAVGMATKMAQTVSIAVGALLVDRVGYVPLLLTITAVVTAAAVPLLIRPADLAIDASGTADIDPEATTVVSGRCSVRTF
jgi:MFS family permease